MKKRKKKKFSRFGKTDEESYQQKENKKKQRNEKGIIQDKSAIDSCSFLLDVVVGILC